MANDRLDSTPRILAAVLTFFLLGFGLGFYAGHASVGRGGPAAATLQVTLAVPLAAQTTSLPPPTVSASGSVSPSVTGTVAASVTVSGSLSPTLSFSGSLSPSVTGTVSGSLSPPVILGDRVLSGDAAATFFSSVACWAGNGSWQEGAEPPLYPRDIPNDMRAEFGTGPYSCTERGYPLTSASLDTRWVPDNAPCARELPVFSPERMCHAMRGRSLVFIGDSLTVLHFETTLQAMAHGRPVPLSVHNGCPDLYQYLNEPSNDAWFLTHTYDFCADVGAKPFTIDYACYNHKLQGYVPASTPADSVPTPDPENAHILWHDGSSPHLWTAHVARLKAMHANTGLVLVVNRGAWVSDDDVVEKGMRQMLQFVREDLPRALFIFRGNTMGHGNCFDYEQRPRRRDEPLIEPSTDGSVVAHRWDYFPRQSLRVVRPLIEANLTHRGVYMDIFPAMQQRPDAHAARGDCLHYCIPGPADQWVRWTFGIIQEVETLGKAFSA